MPPVQSKMNRLAKEQEQTTCVRNQLVGTEELPPTFDFIDCMSTAIMKKFKFLMEMQDHILGEMSKTLKSDLREMLVQSEISETKVAENCSSWEEWEAEDLASKTTELGQKENYEVAECTENLTFKSKEIDKLSCKLDNTKMYPSSQVKGILHKEPRNYQALEGMAAASDINDDTRRNYNNHIQVRDKEERKSHEDGLVEEMDEEKLQSSSNNEKAVKASREEEWLTDPFLSSLRVFKRWGRIFLILRENGFKPELKCEVKLTFKCYGEIQTFLDQQSLRKFANQNPFLKELLNDELPQDEENQGARCEIPVKGDLINSKHEAEDSYYEKEWKDKRTPTFQVGGEDSEEDYDSFLEDDF